MKKKITAMIAALTLILSTGLTLAGCGAEFDPSALVKANLDLFKTGEVTEETLNVITAESEESLKQLYDEELQTLSNGFVDGMLESAGMPEDKRDVFTEEAKGMMKKVYAKAKYEVSEEYTESDGVYYVDVIAYPMDVMTNLETILEEELVPQLQDKIVENSDEYELMSQEELLEDVLMEELEFIGNKVDTTEYGEPVSLTVKVEESNGVYKPNTNDVMDVLSTATWREY